jgi:hypothetical protein
VTLPFAENTGLSARGFSSGGVRAHHLVAAKVEVVADALPT